jgi:hypothetical protein
MVRWQLRVVAPVVLALFAALPALGATITVTSTADSGAGTLRDAISLAAPGDTINFNLTYPTTINLSSDLTIFSSINIVGPGANQLAISGQNSTEVLYVTGGAVVTISGVTIENGSAMMGGGIMNFASNVTLTDSAIVGNTAASSNGGGIFNFDQATLTLNRTTVSGNTAAGTGAGIGSYQFSTLTLINSTISGNTAANGGAGIISDNSTLTVINSTIANNTANVPGGGVVNSNGTLFLKNTLLAANTGGNCSLTGGTSTSDGYNLSDDSSCAVFLTSATDSNGVAAGLDTKGLQNNGGSTSTIALLSTSPAVDALPVASCTMTDGVTPISTDQRGVTRPQGSACDIGAFELAASTGFSSFTARLDIDGERHSRFTLDSMFSLASGASGFDPATDVVKLQIASFSASIPAGSFHQIARGERRGSFFYVGQFGRTWLAVEIVPQGGNSYRLKAEGRPVDFAGITNPVNVTLSVGGTTGTVSVNADLSRR